MREKMAKQAAAANGLPPAMERAASKLVELGYIRPSEMETEGGRGMVVMEEDHPAVFIHLLGAGQPIDAIQETLAQECGAAVDGGPADYVWATNGEADYFFSWLAEVAISELPSRAKWAAEVGLAPRATIRPKADPAQYKRLQDDFDRLHEYIYAARDNVNNANDIIYEICKFIFLKVHLERHPDYAVAALGGRPLNELFSADYVRAEGESAVREIKDTFAEIKERPEYTIVAEDGESFRVFDRTDAIHLNQPETIARIVGMLTRYMLSRPEDHGLEDDLLGRAFDVMLRAKFESKGGLGVYLTPQQVRDAMVQMAFHDIEREDPGAITRRDPGTGKPSFRVGDPACGSGGFLVTAMREVRKYVNRLVGLTDDGKEKLLSGIFAEGFVGADNSPGMVIMARINMILHGDPEARVYRVPNALTTPALKPESFDLILTNPPFKGGGVTVGDQPDLLEYFRSDVTADGQCRMGSAGLSLGASPDGRGRWRALRSQDPAILFLDRCLQLLKPGGRLVMVLPDGILSNSGERYVREYLMGRKDAETGHFFGGKAVVKAVVSLPQVTFRLSGAGAKTSFLYVQKKRPGDEQGSVFMAVVDHVGFDIKQNKEIVTNKNDLLRVVEDYKNPTASWEPELTAR